nr:hypothetical protein [Candidatus Nanoperiomorbaceae bacterium]
ISGAQITALMNEPITIATTNKLRLGGTTVARTYVGSRQVHKAYLGAQLVYDDSTTAPTPGGGSDPDPVLTDFPDATNTGYLPTGQTLTRVPEQITSGPGWAWMTVYGQPCVNIYEDGAVLSGLDINGAIYNNGSQNPHAACSNVTIDKCRVRGTGEENWVITLGPNSTIRDSEIGGGADGVTTVAIGILSGYYAGNQAQNTILRCNIHHVEHGMRVDGNTLVQDSYFHDFLMDNPANHTDVIMCTAGTGITMLHNTFECGVNNSGIFIQWQTGNVQIGTVTIEHNYFQFLSKYDANPSWGISYENKGVANPAQTTIKDNVFDLAFKTTWGSGAASAPAGFVASGNVYTDDSPVVIEEV